VSVSVQIGLLFALGTSLASIVGFLLKARGAVAAPEVEWSRPIHSTFALFASGWYSLGVLVALGGWGLHVTALALAPISLVQTTIAGGLVLLTVVAERVFGQRVTRREWIGVGLTAAGLAVLAGTLGSGGDGRHADYQTVTLALYVGALAAAAVIAWAVARPGAVGAPVLALSAGLMWAASDTTIKALSDRVSDSLLTILVNPLALTILVLSLVGLLVSAGSLQRGKAVPVIAITSAAANITTIAAGPIVFGEPLPGDQLGIALRLMAFALVIGAAALTPPPLAEAEAEAPPHPA
jgi:drug/metabolite transporter (DMT)-like permease